MKQDTALTELIQHIETLKSQCFYGWREMEINAYNTALTSIKNKAIELLPKEREQIENFGSIVINNAVKRINKDPEGINADELFDKTFTQHTDKENP